MTMKINKLESKEFLLFEINAPAPLVKMRVLDVEKRKELKAAQEDTSLFRDRKEELEIREAKGTVVVRKELGIDEHILGLGEKAFETDRRRISVQMWNYDAYSYGWHTDPLYVSIPFFISVTKNNAQGYFFNSASRLSFDIGVKEYNKIVVTIPEERASFYIIKGPTIQQVLENYATLSGKPFLPPRWALGHQISRYSYYPQDSLVAVVKEYLLHGYPVSAVYLDIDYLDEGKLFTWAKKRFPDPKKLIKELHSLGTKVIVNVNPGIRLSQSYEVFQRGLGCYCELEKGELYAAKVWPGLCVFPDFLNPEARAFWKEELARFVSIGIDGVWLDMNEPAVFNQSKTFEENVLHQNEQGKAIEHRLVHNAYSYFQAAATYEAMQKEKNDQPFILSRAGYAGIQKYAAIWSGDNVGSWEDLKLQLPLLLGLSLSGVPFVGCDLGGFVGRSDPELLTRYYQLATFFPLFRNHKTKEGNDQEPFRLPAKYQEKVKKAISLRYSLMPYLYSLAYEAHRFGHPILRPLAYEFQQDENVFGINDQYMVGKYLLFAPILQKEKEDRRELYLPKGTWMSWQGDEEILQGESWITSISELPLYLRRDSIVPHDQGISVWGTASFTLFDGKEYVLTASGSTLKSSKLLAGKREIRFRQLVSRQAFVDRAAASETRQMGDSTLVLVNNFQEIHLEK